MNEHTSGFERIRREHVNKLSIPHKTHSIITLNIKCFEHIMSRELLFTLKSNRPVVGDIESRPAMNMGLLSSAVPQLVQMMLDPYSDVFLLLITVNWFRFSGGNYNYWG